MKLIYWLDGVSTAKIKSKKWRSNFKIVEKFSMGV
jgi:hypothetical protein